MILSDLCEAFEEQQISDDTPIRLVHDGTEFEVTAIAKQHDGSVVFELEEV